MRTSWVVVAALLAACTCGDDAADDASAAANESLSKLAHCLLGPPLAAGERAAQRARDVQLGMSTRPAAGDPWPRRCASFGEALAADLDRAAGADAEKYGAAQREAA